MAIYTRYEFHVILMIKVTCTKVFTYFKVVSNRGHCFSVM